MITFGLSRNPIRGTADEQAQPAATYAASLLLERSLRTTAILCMSDRLAEGALLTGGAHGLEVPRDVSIMGFDGGGPAERLGLTTVAQPTRHKGQLAARALLALIDGERVQPVQTLATELVVRSGTAAPPDRTND